MCQSISATQSVKVYFFYIYHNMGWLDKIILERKLKYNTSKNPRFKNTTDSD